jgi:hypothetical protein
MVGSCYFEDTHFELFSLHSKIVQNVKPLVEIKDFSIGNSLPIKLSFFSFQYIIKSEPRENCYYDLRDKAEIKIEEVKIVLDNKPLPPIPTKQLLIAKKLPELPAPPKTPLLTSKSIIEDVDEEIKCFIEEVEELMSQPKQPLQLTFKEEPVEMDNFEGTEEESLEEASESGVEQQEVNQWDGLEGEEYKTSFFDKVNTSQVSSEITPKQEDDSKWGDMEEEEHEFSFLKQVLTTDVPRDGHCLFHCFSHYLHIDMKVLRNIVLDFNRVSNKKLLDNWDEGLGTDLCATVLAVFYKLNLVCYTGDNVSIIYVANPDCLEWLLISKVVNENHFKYAVIQSKGKFKQVGDIDLLVRAVTEFYNVVTQDKPKGNLAKKEKGTCIAFAPTR